MLKVTLIAVGSLKESYWRDACAEYEKRLGAFCRLSQVVIREAKLPDDPTEGEIANALKAEERQILEAMPPKSFRIALCVEGKQLSSEELAEKIGEIATAQGAITLVIGSSHGLSSAVKEACDLRLSFSKMTFPHQLMRVVLLEALYRAMNILRGTKYHK